MLKSIAQLFSLHIIVKLIGLATIGIVLEFLSIENFGKYSFYILFLHLIAIIVDPFLAAYLVEYKIFDYKKYNGGIFFLSLILIPFFYLALFLFNLNIEIKVFLLFCSTFLLSGLLKSFLNVREEFFKYGLIDVFRQSAILLSTIFYFFYFDRIDFLSLLEVNYFVTSIILLLCIPFFIKKTEIFFDTRKSTYIKLIENSKYLIFYTAIIPILSFIDSYFVDKFLNEKDLGLYSFSLKVYNISLMLVIPIFTVLNIKQIKIAKAENYLSFLNKNFKKVLFFSLSFFILFLLINTIITQYIYTSYSDTFLPTSILLIGSFIAYLTIPFSFLIAYRKYRHLFSIAILAILINITLNFLLIEKYGILIAAISTALSQIIINLGAALVSYFLLKKRV